MDNSESVMELSESVMELSEESPKVLESYRAFVKDLETLINKHSIEDCSGTPGFILADFMLSSLKAGERLVKRRAEWYKGNK